jgi:hypothetical protein
MTYDDLKLISHRNTGAKRFGYWIYFRDRRKHSETQGIKGRKEIITFFESRLGEIGQRWQYQKVDQNGIFLKINDERDFLFLLLKLS